jgi:L-fuconolactonase
VTSKRLDGRDEAIVEPDLPIIDTHHHLFLRPYVRYLFDDFLEDINAGHNIVGSIYMDAQSMIRTEGPAIMRGLGEVEFALGMAAMSASGMFGPRRVAAAIVASALVSEGESIADYLDRAIATAPALLRGVRQIAMTTENPHIKPLLRYHVARGTLRGDVFRAGFRQVYARGLSFETSLFHSQLDDLADLADAFPYATIIFSHLGMAEGLGLDEAGRQDVFAEWRRAMRDLAKRPNVICKVGGLGNPYWGFGFDKRPGPTGSAELAAVWRPYVEEAMSAFGADRCMAESNFPVDGVSCGYVPLWNALKLCVQGCSADEKAALFRETARRVYRVDI